MPRSSFIPPCNPTLRDRLPKGEGWLFEVKFDGYRLQVHKAGERVILYTRNGADWTYRFPRLADEFEREMIVARVKAGIARAQDAIERDGHFISRAGHLRKRLGRPGASPNKLAAARRELAKGTGILKTARLTGLGTGTVQRLKRETAPSSPGRGDWRNEGWDP